MIKILIAFALTCNAFAANLPLSVKGQGSAIIKNVTDLTLPNQQVTSLGKNTVHLETGNNNILHNPSFEQATLDAGVTTWNHGALVPVLEESSTVIAGKKVLVFNASAQSILLTQSSTLYEAAFADGVQCLASIRVKTNHSEAVNVCSIQAGVTSTTNCVVANNDNKWGLYKVPFICGATSNGISAVGASGTGTTYIDDAFVGAQDLKQDIASLKSQASTIIQTATFASATITGAVSTTNGADLYSYVSGTGIYTALKNITVVAGVSFTNASAASSLPVIRKNSTDISVGSTAATTSLWASTSASFIVLIGETFSVANATASQTSAQKITITATEIINTSIYSASCGANCVDSFNGQVTTTPAFLKPNIPWVTSVAKSGTSNQVKTLTIPSGVFPTNVPACTCSVDFTVGGTDLTCVMDSSTSTLTSLVFSTRNNGTPIDAAFNVNCPKNGADFVASRTIVGAFKDIPTTLGTSGSDIQSVYFGTGATCASACTTGTCTSCTKVGTKITSVSFVATGLYNVNGIDGTKYNCSITSGWNGTMISSGLHSLGASTSTYARIQYYTTAATPASTNVGLTLVTCIGKP